MQKRPQHLPIFVGFDHPEFERIFNSFKDPMKKRVIFCWTILLSVFVFVVLLNTVDFLRPAQESNFTWFERSGALLGACAVFVEFKLKLIDEILSSGSMKFEPESYKKLVVYHYKKEHLHRAALAFGIVGTIIWSYGSPIWLFVGNIVEYIYS